MSDNDEIKDELKELAPFLARLKKSDGQQEVPDGYFDALENRLSDKLLAQKNEKSRVLRLWTYTGIAVAASIALFFLTNSPLTLEYPETTPMSSEELLVMDQFDALELEYYLVADDESIDAESLLLEEDNLEELLNI